MTFVLGGSDASVRDRNCAGRPLYPGHGIGGKGVFEGDREDISCGRDGPDDGGGSPYKIEGLVDYSRSRAVPRGIKRGVLRENECWGQGEGEEESQESPRARTVFVPGIEKG